MTQWRTEFPQTGPTQSQTGFCSLVGAGQFIASEASEQTKFYVAYTVSALRVNVIANDGTSTAAFRDDGVSSSNQTISITGTGWQEDVTGSDTPAANSLCCIAVIAGGSHGNLCTVRVGLLTYEHASTKAPLIGFKTGSMNADNWLMAAHHGGGGSAALGFAEADSKTKVNEATGVSNLRAYLSTASASGLTIAIGNDGVSSSNVTISPAGTGATEDITGSESIASGHDMNFRAIRTANTWNITQGQAQLDTSTAKYGVNANFSATTREFEYFGNARNSTVADDNYTGRIGTATAANLRCSVITAGSGTRDCTLRVDAADSTNLTVSLTGTGFFEDTTGSDSIGDTTSIGFSVASTGSAVACGQVGLDFPQVASGTSATITGVPATATPVAAVAGIVTTVRIVAISGATATATADARSGAVQVVRTIAGATATADASAIAGAVTTVRIVSVTGTTATAAADAIAGNVTAQRIVAIAGATATATADGVAGSVQIARSVTGVTATATADAIAGSVSTAGSAAVSGATATATSDGVAGSVQAYINATVTGATATANADAIAGSVVAVGIVSISGTTATASADVKAGAVSTVPVANISGELAAASADAIAGSVAAVRIVAVLGATATAQADAIAGAVTAVRQISIVGAVATAAADAVAGAVGAQVTTAIAGATSTAGADAIAGSIAAAEIVSVVGTTATASADAIPGTVQTGGAVSVTGATATAAATANPGTVQALRAASISGATATAVADALAGAVHVSRAISGATATASSVAVPGVVSTVQTRTIAGATATAGADAIPGLFGVPPAPTPPTPGGGVSAGPHRGLFPRLWERVVRREPVRRREESVVPVVAEITTVATTRVEVAELVVTFSLDTQIATGQEKAARMDVTVGVEASDRRLWGGEWRILGTIPETEEELEEWLLEV